MRPPPFKVLRNISSLLLFAIPVLRIEVRQQFALASSSSSSVATASAAAGLCKRAQPEEFCVILLSAEVLLHPLNSTRLLKKKKPKSSLFLYRLAQNHEPRVMAAGAEGASRSAFLVPGQVRGSKWGRKRRGAEVWLASECSAAVNFIGAGRLRPFGSPEKSQGWSRGLPFLFAPSEVNISDGEVPAWAPWVLDLFPGRVLALFVIFSSVSCTKLPLRAAGCRLGSRRADLLGPIRRRRRVPSKGALVAHDALRTPRPSHVFYSPSLVGALDGSFPVYLNRVNRIKSRFILGGFAAGRRRG